MGKVVNRRDSEFDVYIGRGSRWGNPFKIVAASRTRDEAIECYRTWLWTQIKTGEISVTDLAKLNGKRLGCYCAPLPCHGDVLVAAAAWAASKDGWTAAREMNESLEDEADEEGYWACDMETGRIIR